MPHTEVEVVNSLGVHARPAARFATTAARYRAEITVQVEDRSANGKSIMAMMMLAARQGTVLRVQAEGVDAEAALAALRELVMRGFEDLGVGVMSLRLGGNGVSRGLAIGQVHLVFVDSDGVRTRREVEDPKAELLRLRRAIRSVKRQLEASRDRLPRDFPKDVRAFIDTHYLILDDVTFSRPVANIIRAESCDAEWALRSHRATLLDTFARMDDPYLRTRRDDISFVIDRLLRALDHGAPESSDLTLPRGTVAVASDVSPVELAELSGRGIAGLVIERGGPLSHTAIAARSLGIPMVATAASATRLLRDGETVVINGSSGLVLAAPDKRSLQAFRRADRDARRLRRARQKPTPGVAQTLDRVPITLDANVDQPADVAAARRAGASGIGLFRTEYLFLDREQPPSETQQLEVYRRLLRSMRGAPVTIRTLDLWAHARIAGLEDLPFEPGQPALGLRAIRLCLQYPELFRPQLRALLRAAGSGPLRILLPMVSNVGELRQVRALIDGCMEELRRQRLLRDPDYTLGMMVEVPAAAISAHLFAPHVDFFAIGTNDLVQYALAIDRDDEAVQYLYDPLHPAVLSLIRTALQAGERTGTPVTLCGEMAGDPRFTRLLLGLGLRSFSMHCSALPEVKQVLAQSDSARCARAARRLLESEDQPHAVALLQRLNRGLQLD